MKLFDHLDKVIWCGVIVVLAAALMVCPGARGATPIPGFQTSVNDTGFNFSSAVLTPITTTGAPGSGQWDPTYFNTAYGTFKPKAARHMDLWQVVTNNTTTWANRSTSDFSPNGITYETTINLDNKALTLNPAYTPWINSPIFADADHDFKLGQLYGQNYKGHRIIFGKGDEGWNIFGNNLPAQNLFAARVKFPGVDDFTAAGELWGQHLGLGETSFEAGLHSVPGHQNDEVDMAIEGFSPITGWAQNQINGMKAIGINPAQHHGRISIGMYAAGSATDLQGPTATNDQKATAVLNFIQTSLVPWTAAHRQLAIANGLAPVVDAYEMRLGTPSNGPPTADWVAFQNSPQEAMVQDQGYRALLAAAGGTDAIFNTEGFVGFPFSNGIFSLADYPSQYANPAQSQAWSGLQSLIDYSSIPQTPEPSGFVIISAIWITLNAGRKRGRSHSLMRTRCGGKLNCAA